MRTSTEDLQPGFYEWPLALYTRSLKLNTKTQVQTVKKIVNLRLKEWI